MTLLDFCYLIRKHIVLVIALPVVCALACLGFLTFGNSNDSAYTAQSRIVVSTHVQEVGGLAQAQGRIYTDEDENIKVTASVDSNTKTVTISAVTSDEDLSIELANKVANAVLQEAFDFVPDNEMDPFNARVEQASKLQESVAKKGLFKYLIVSVFAGLFLAICVLVIIDMVKRPIKSVENIKAAVDLPMLEEMSKDDNGERLLANVRFAIEAEDCGQICLIPVSDGTSIEKVAASLRAAANAESPQTHIEINCQDSLANNVKVAYEARKADAVVLVATQWKDSLTALESAVADLKLANANLVGIVLTC